MRDGIWISADGRERYVGGFYHGRYEGRGVLYREMGDADFQVQIFKGEFYAGRPSGKGDLQIIRNPNDPVLETFFSVNPMKTRK